MEIYKFKKNKGTKQISNPLINAANIMQQFYGKAIQLRIQLVNRGQFIGLLFEFTPELN